MKNLPMKVFLNTFLLAGLLGAVLPANAGTSCPDAQAAQAAAAEQTVTQNKALNPVVNNPTVQSVDGPQCINESSTYETILQDIQSMPIGSSGEKVLQVLEQLLGNSQNTCNPSGQSDAPATPQGGSLPTMNLVTPTAQTPTSDSNGKDSSSGLYQSLFP